MPAESRVSIAGELVTIRPIRIADAAIEKEFISRLSMESRRFRFMGGVNELPPAEVARLCTVDGRQSMALVATILKGGLETEIGVSRYAAGPQPDAGEFAVTIADDWQHKGLGTLLMQQLIQSARHNGIRRLYAVAFWDNDGMRALARHLGMTESRDPGNAQQAIYSLAL